MRALLVAATVLLAAPSPSEASEVDGGPTPAHRRDDGPSGEQAAAAPEEVRAAPPADLAPRLELGLGSSLATSGALLAAAGVAGSARAGLTPGACRWCEPDRLDRWARGELRWRSPSRAARASDALLLAVPAGAAGALALQALAAGAGGREVAEDLAAVTEAMAVSAALTQGAKLSTGRLRPEPWASGRAPAANDLHAFWSGHTSFAFAAAAGATQVARLRRRPGWRWLAAAAFGGAAAVGWLRVAGDQHWLTDVLAGAAVGTAAGLGVPALVLRPAGGRSPGLALVPVPGGLALAF